MSLCFKILDQCVFFFYFTKDLSIEGLRVRKARTGEVTGRDVLTVHCHVYDIIT